MSDTCAHPSISRYQRHGCRCDECREIASARQRRVRDAKRALLPITDDSAYCPVCDRWFVSNRALLNHDRTH